jgi:hypothetical protein
MTYALRLIYEEKREQFSLGQRVITTTGDVVAKLISLGAIKKRPALNLLHDALRSLARFHLLIRGEGNWEDSQTKLMILPSILFVVGNEQIAGMAKLLDEAPEEEPLEEEDML